MGGGGGRGALTVDYSACEVHACTHVHVHKSRHVYNYMYMYIEDGITAAKVLPFLHSSLRQGRIVGRDRVFYL